MQSKLCSKLALVLLLAGGIITSQAASVGSAGYTNAFTGAAPGAADWSTRSVPGASGDLLDATALGAAVITNSTSSITAALTNGGAGTPGSSLAAVWGSDGFLQTRAAANAYTLLMATFVNASGSNATGIRISFDFTAAIPTAEQVPGHLVYYSLTGAANSWSNLATLQSSNSTTLSTNLTLSPPWNDGATLYLLFADDNAAAAPDTACQIDNFFIGVTAGTAVTGTPTIALDSPTNSQSIDQGIDITISASTTGAATNVTFYRDGAVLIGSDASNPYSVVYSNAALGAHTLTAVVQGNGQSVTSSVVNITVVVVPPPTVTITSPTNTQSTVQGTNITINASTTGKATNVTFYRDGEVLIGSDASSPYSVVYSNAVVGAHTLTAVVQDSLGLSVTSSVVNITVTPPTVTITSPTNTQSIVQGTNITIIASTTGTTTNVTFYRDSAVLIGSDASAPYSMVYSNATLGAHTLTAVVQDSLGLSVTSSVVNITVTIAPPPTITITSPTNTQSLAVGTGITINATTTGSATNVTFYRDGTVVIGSDASSPFSTVYGGATLGAHTLTAVVQSSAGESVTSSVVNITVVQVPVSITSQPQSLGVAAGGVASFTVGVSGTTPYLYQWRKAGSPIANATNQTYIIAITALGDAGTYSVVVSNSISSATSSNASLTVTVLPYVLLNFTNVWKYNQSNIDLGTLWKDVAYNDSGWPSGPGVFEAKNGAVPAFIAPLVGTTLPAPPANGTDTPTYYFRTKVVLNDAPSSVTLSVTNLLDDGAVFYVNGVETDRVRLPTGLVTFNTLASSTVGDAAFETTIQPTTSWIRGTNVLAVEMHQASLSSSDITFGMKIIATVQPPASLSITSQPVNVVVQETKPASFSVGVSGAGALFQWFHDGVPVAGADSSIYTIPVAAVSNSGAYFVMVSNAVNAVFSTNVFLNVLVDTNPPTLVKADGSMATTSVLVSFDELVSPVTATNAANYAIASTTGSVIPVTGATMQQGTNVLLVTGARTDGINYILTVNGVRDVAPASNLILTNSAIPISTILNMVPLASGSWLFNQPFVPFNLPVPPNWMQPTYTPTNVVDGGDWDFGTAAFVFDLSNEALPVTKVTALSQGVVSSYYRHSFFYNGSPIGASLRMRHAVDDGAVFYLNGVEFLRFNMPGGTITDTTTASSAIGVVGLSSYIDIPLNKIVLGTNLLAVELHQDDPESRDAVFAMELQAIVQSVTNGPVVIAGQPANQTVFVGQPVTFSFSSAAANSVQWQQNGTNLLGQTNVTYTIPVTTLAMSGYTFRVIATGTGGTATSSNAVLNVITPAPPTPPYLTIARGGTTVTLSWTNSGVTLQQATNLLSTNTAWADVPGPVTASPYSTNNPAGPRYYRLRR